MSALLTYKAGKLLLTIAGSSTRVEGTGVSAWDSGLCGFSRNLLLGTGMSVARDRQEKLKFLRLRSGNWHNITCVLVITWIQDTRRRDINLHLLMQRILKAGDALCHNCIYIYI